MAQTGYTPILIYASGTATNVPLAANLTSSASGAELALNYADGKLFYKNSSGVVTLLASAAGAAGDVVGPASATDNALARFDTTTGKLIQNSVAILSDAGVLTGLTGLTSSGNVTLSALTSTRVPYASTGGLLVDSANMVFNGTRLTVADLADSGLTSGRVTYAASGGALVDSANLTFDGTTLTAAGFAGPLNGTVGATTASTGAFTTLTTSGAVTHNAGTANGVAFLNGSKVLTTGSALTFDGTNTLGVNSASATTIAIDSSGGNFFRGISFRASGAEFGFDRTNSSTGEYRHAIGPSAGWGGFHTYYVDGAEQMRLTSTGLGIGTSSPENQLQVGIRFGVSSGGVTRWGQVITASGRSNSGYLTWDTGLVAIGAEGATAMRFDTNGAEAMRITTAGNVGIGTSSPTSRLTIGTGTYSSAASGSTGMYTTATGLEMLSDSYFFGSRTGGALMLLNSSGNLGLGVTPSAWNADYKVEQIGSTSSFYGRVASGQTGVGENFYRDAGGAFRYLTTGPTSRFEMDSSAFYWYTAGSGTAGNAISFTQAMTLDASGNLGIGTSSPDNKLVVSGGIAATGAGSFGAGNVPGLYASYESGGEARLMARGTGATTNYLTFWTTTSGSSSEKMRLDSSGNLGIGTSSPIGKCTSSEGFTATGIATPTNTNTNSVQIGHDGTDGVIRAWNTTGLSLSAFNPIKFTTGGSERARITSGGDLLVGTTSNVNLARIKLAWITGTYGIESIASADTLSYHMIFGNASNAAAGNISTTNNTTTYAVISDYRLKTVIGPVANAGQRIDALQPVEYTWNASGERTRGFLAHQFQEVYAGSVSGTKDAVDAEGKPVYQSMQASTSEVIADLVALLQEHRAEIASLKTRLAAAGI